MQHLQSQDLPDQQGQQEPLPQSQDQLDQLDQQEPHQLLLDPLALLVPQVQQALSLGRQDPPDLQERLQLLQVQLGLQALQARLQQLQAPLDRLAQREQVRQSLAQLDQRVPQVRRVP